MALKINTWRIVLFFILLYISKQILQYKYHDLQNHELIIVWIIIFNIKRIGNIKNPNLSKVYKMWIILYYKIKNSSGNSSSRMQKRNK